MSCLFEKGNVTVTKRPRLQKLFYDWVQLIYKDLRSIGNSD